MPRVLREFGLRFGWQGRLARACETLLAPNAWRLQGGALVFCVENQGVVVWGLRRADLAQDDPPGLRGQTSTLRVGRTMSGCRTSSSL